MPAEHVHHQRMYVFVGQGVDREFMVICACMHVRPWLAAHAHVLVPSVVQLHEVRLEADKQAQTVSTVRYSWCMFHPSLAPSDETHVYGHDVYGQALAHHRHAMSCKHRWVHEALSHSMLSNPLGRRICSSRHMCVGARTAHYGLWVSACMHAVKPAVRSSHSLPLAASPPLRHPPPWTSPLACMHTCMNAHMNECTHA